MAIPDDWWDTRFFYQEVMDMSILGRSLFVFEVSQLFCNQFLTKLFQNITQNKSLNGKKENFKILVWKFEKWAKRKYVNAYTNKAKDVFADCSVRWRIRGII